MSRFIKQVFQGKSIYRILFNRQVEKYCQDLTGICLDLAGGEDPSYYNFWSFNKSAKLIKTDFNSGKNVDVVVDLNQALPFENNFADNIFLFNALYIIKDTKGLIKEVYRILKKDGKLFIGSPFIFNEAKEPNDYCRLTSQGLKELLEQGGFDDFEIIPFGERATAAVHLLHNFFIFNFIRLIVFFQALLFDKIIPKKICRLHSCPLGYFVIAKK